MDYVLVSTEKFYRRFLPVKVTLENIYIYIFAEKLAQFFFNSVLCYLDHYASSTNLQCWPNVFSILLYYLRFIILRLWTRNGIF